MDLEPTLRFAERLNAMGKPVWVRFVLVPGLTDDPANIEKVARFVAPMANVEWVEVLPFHQMGVFKWKTLGWSITLADTPPPERRAGECRARDLSRRRLPRPLRASGLRRGTCHDPVVSDLIGSQPILALFLAVGLGYAVGQINILGFSLGIGAVLFVGLSSGPFAPKAQIAGPIGLIGLTMFLYGIGILYGRQFFEGLTGPGRIYNLLPSSPCCGGLLVALGLGKMFGVEHRPDARHLCRLDDQHRDAAGGPRCDRQAANHRSAIRLPTRLA